MTTNPVTPRSVFLRMAVPFIIGLGVGLSVGYPMGKWQLAAPAVSTSGKASETAALSSEKTPAQGTAAPSNGVQAPAAETASGKPGETATQTAEVTPPSANWPARYLFVAVKGTSLDDATQSMLKDLKPGGVVLRAENIENRNQTIALVRAIKEAVGYGTDLADLPLIAVAQEGGTSTPSTSLMRRAQVKWGRAPM